MSKLPVNTKSIKATSARLSAESTPWSLSSLEPRRMLAGDAAVAIVDSVVPVGDQSVQQTVAETEVIECGKLVLIDAAIHDVERLQAAVSNDADIVLLSPNSDAIQQISAALASRVGIKELHIVSHGEAAALRLGNVVVDNDTLAARAAEILRWQSSLAPDADIMLYGCSVAQNNAGNRFIARLAKLTGADVAASKDRTGNTKDGGNWQLEKHFGTVEAQLVFSVGELNRFSHTLDITINAWGSTGEEKFTLTIDGTAVKEYSVKNTNTTFVYQTDQILKSEQIGIVFSNDAYNAATGYDRNLTIDNIKIDGKTFETEVSNVFSNGTYFNGELSPGFGRGQDLHVNGRFQFGAAPSSNGSTITVNASGSTGEEKFNLRIDNQVVATFDAAKAKKPFTFTAPGTVTADRIRVEFINDVYDPAKGIDRNLYVDNIVVDGKVFETEANTVFSTGTWKQADGFVDGFRQDEGLHRNGYFQYNAKNIGAQQSLVLDNTFAGDGLADQPNSQNSSTRVMIQTTDGSIVTAAGNTVRKIRSDGQLDATFGINGVASLGLGLNPRVYDIEATPDGGFFVVGAEEVAGTSGLPTVLVRLRADGSSAGRSFLDSALGGVKFEEAGANIVQASSFGTDIVLASRSDNNSIALIRIGARGIDTFGDGSTSTLNTRVEFPYDPNGLTPSVFGLKHSSNGDVFVGFGNSIAKLSATGIVDKSFGTNGIATIPPIAQVSPTDFAIDSMGRIVVSGNSTAIARLTAQGTPDLSFGSGGVAVLQFDPFLDVDGQQVSSVRINNLSLDSQDRIMVSSSIQTSFSGIARKTGLFFARVNTDGTPDRTFDSDGSQLIAATSAAAVTSGEMLIDSAGRVLVYGQFMDGSNNSFPRDAFVARYALA